MSSEIEPLEGIEDLMDLRFISFAKPTYLVKYREKLLDILQIREKGVGALDLDYLVSVSRIRKETIRVCQVILNGPTLLDKFSMDFPYEDIKNQKECINKCFSLFEKHEVEILKVPKEADEDSSILLQLISEWESAIYIKRTYSKYLIS